MFIQRLIFALNKSQRAGPGIHTKVMQLEPFHKLFEQWPGNEVLELPRLRIKAITLLALALMLRPSHLAPRGETCNAQTGEVDKMTFTND